MNILAIGSHPDDIEIGCGGTLHKLYRMGHAVSALVLTHGEIGGDPLVRKTEQENSARILGFKKLFWGGYRDTQIPQHADVINKIEAIVIEARPDVVFVHAPEDTHQDHRYVNACTLSATRHIKTILFYEVPTTIDFTPNIFFEIGPDIESKLESLKAHASQMNRTNITDLSILRIAEALANFRGTQSRVKFAEGFKTPRMLLNLGLAGL